MVSLPASIGAATSSHGAASALGSANAAGQITLDTSLSYVDNRMRPLSMKTQAYVAHIELEVERKRKLPKTTTNKPKAVKPANYVAKPCTRFANGGKCHFGSRCWDTH